MFGDGSPAGECAFYKSPVPNALSDVCLMFGLFIGSLISIDESVCVLHYCYYIALYSDRRGDCKVSERKLRTQTHTNAVLSGTARTHSSCVCL